MRACVRAGGHGKPFDRTKKTSLSLDRYRVGRCTKEPTDTISNGTSSGLKEKLCNSAGQKLDRAYMWRPGDGERARFGSRGCPRELDRGRQFYSKSLLLGAPKAEAAR